MEGETVKTHVRGYIRAIPGLPLNRQRQMADDAGCSAIYDASEPSHSRMSQREQWVTSLRRGDVAWVASLRCLLLAPAEREKGYSPTADLASITNYVLAIGAILADARGKCTSEDPAEWARHVLAEARRAGQGERPITELRRNLRKAREAIPAGVTTRWLAPDMADQLEMQRAVWATSKRTTAGAKKLLHPELRKLSNKTLYAILGDRFGGRKGGRPRKVKQD